MQRGFGHWFGSIAAHHDCRHELAPRVLVEEFLVSGANVGGNSSRILFGKSRLGVILDGIFCRFFERDYSSVLVFGYRDDARWCRWPAESSLFVVVVLRNRGYDLEVGGMGMSIPMTHYNREKMTVGDSGM